MYSFRRTNNVAELRKSIYVETRGSGGRYVFMKSGIQINQINSCASHTEWYLVCAVRYPNFTVYLLVSIFAGAT